MDTNVWVSAAINPAGFPARVADAFARGHFVAVVPDVILAEIAAVLRRERVRRLTGHTDEDLERFVALIAARAEVVATRGQRYGCRDAKDDALLEGAVLSGAEAVVTRDDDLKGDQLLVQAMRDRGVSLLSVSSFLQLLAAPRTWPSR